MLLDSYPYYMANEAHQPNTDLVVTDKFTGEPATRVALADAAAFDAGIAAAVDADEAMRSMPPYERQAILLALRSTASRNALRNYPLPCALKPANRLRTAEAK